MNSPLTQHIRRIALCACAALSALGMGWALDTDALRAYSAVTDVSGRPGVQLHREYCQQHNSRNLYTISYEANIGTPVQIAPDKQTEGSRRPYDPYVTKPSPEEEGFTPVALSPEYNWSDQGFFNVYLNNVGFEYTEPVITSGQLTDHIFVKYVWTNSQGTVTQTFAFREHDDKLLMRIAVTAASGVTLGSARLHLRNIPKLGENVYSIPGNTRNNAIAISTGEQTYGQRVDLTPTSNYWVAYYNKDIGVAPSGLLFNGSTDISSAHVLVSNDDIQTVLTLKLSKASRVYDFILWDMPKMTNSQFVAYLTAQAATLKTKLNALSSYNWESSLPTAEAEPAPLHLVNAIRTPTAQETSRGYVLGEHTVFDYADANTLPATPITGLNITACPGQSEPATFLMYGLQDLGTVTAGISDLMATSGGEEEMIPASQCDLRVVKVWVQAEGTSAGITTPYYMTPELLLRNDTLDVTQAWGASGPGISGFVTGTLTTTIPRDHTKQFWLTVKVPPTALAGTYTGTITLTPQNGTASTLPVTVEVLPFTLASPDNRYILGTYYRGMPWPDPTPSNPVMSDYVTLDRFQEDLQALRELGYNALWSNYPRRVSGMTVSTYTSTVFDYAASLGFRSPIIVSDWGYAYNTNFNQATNDAHRAVISSFLQECYNNPAYPLPAFYGIDEPTGTEINTTIQRADITRGVTYNGLVGEYAVAGNTNDQLYGHLDYPIISAYFNNHTQMNTQRQQYQSLGESPLYYWQIWGEYPKSTRLQAGYFLYKSGFNGILPFCYQMWNTPNPYEEYNKSMKPMMTMYPSADGPIFTLQSEAARTGIIDLRYIITLEEKMAQVDAVFGPQATAAMRTQLSDTLAKYNYGSCQYWGRMIYGATNWPDMQVTVQNAQFNTDRQVIISLIQQCEDLLN